MTGPRVSDEAIAGVPDEEITDADYRPLPDVPLDFEWELTQAILAEGKGQATSTQRALLVLFDRWHELAVHYGPHIRKPE